MNRVCWQAKGQAALSGPAIHFDLSLVFRESCKPNALFNEDRGKYYRAILEIAVSHDQLIVHTLHGGGTVPSP